MFCTIAHASGVSLAGYAQFGSVRCGFRIYLPKGIQQGGCNYTSTSGTIYCPWQGISASKQNLLPHMVWTSTRVTREECTGSNAYRAYGLNGTGWNASSFCATTKTNNYTDFGSVRCVLVLE